MLHGIKRCQSQLEPVLQINMTVPNNVLENDFRFFKLWFDTCLFHMQKGLRCSIIRNYLHVMELIAASTKRTAMTVSQNKNQKYYGKTRFVVERFFAWLKCGFHRILQTCSGFVIIMSDLFTWHQF